MSNNLEIKPPLWVLLELTHKCPLECTYCYNQLDFASTKDEMTKEDWFRVMDEVRELGAVQLGISGGEPLLNKDVVEIVAYASKLGFYTNLITSGVGAPEGIIGRLKDAGLKTVQLGIQSHDEKTMKLVTNNKSAYNQKLKIAKEIKDAGLQLIVNTCITRQNIHQVEEIIDFADETLDADYLEIANIQYYGWALENINALLPNKEQLQKAKEATDAYRQRKPHMKTFFVVPDYFADRPKACMNGLGTTFLTINPDGMALPCNTANTMPIDWPSVKNNSIKEIWYDSEPFNYFRGDSWMKEPCRTCDERDKDFGGCRCQAYALTGDMHAADPVCSKSPDRAIIDQKIKNSVKFANQDLVYRNKKNSLAFMSGTFR